MSHRIDLLRPSEFPFPLSLSLPFGRMENFEGFVSVVRNEIPGPAITPIGNWRQCPVPMCLSYCCGPFSARLNNRLRRRFHEERERKTTDSTTLQPGKGCRFGQQQLSVWGVSMTQSSRSPWERRRVVYDDLLMYWSLSSGDVSVSFVYLEQWTCTYFVSTAPQIVRIAKRNAVEDVIFLPCLRRSSWPNLE